MKKPSRISLRNGRRHLFPWHNVEGHSLCFENRISFSSWDTQLKYFIDDSVCFVAIILIEND